MVDWKRLKKETQDILDELKITNIKPTDMVEYLTAGKRQMVEIAKAMSFKPKVIQLDEPHPLWRAMKPKRCSTFCAA